MKKVLTLLLSLSMLLCLLACEPDTTSSHSHVFSKATCSSPAKCSCGVTNGVALEHKYVYNRCSICGHIRLDYIVSSADYFKNKTFAMGSDSIIHYLFHEPIRDTQKDYPLIIFLHGLNNDVSINNLGASTKLVNSLIELENESESFSTYTLVPSTPLPSEGWWTQSQKDALIALIRKLVATYNIDPTRIYVTGVSMGGMVTCELVDECPNSFAAAVPLSGCTRMSVPENAKSTAFRIYHAIYDDVVSIESARGFYQQLVNSNHPNVELFELESPSHSAPLAAAYENDFREFFGWLFNQKLSTDKFSSFS